MQSSFFLFQDLSKDDCITETHLFLSSSPPEKKSKIIFIHFVAKLRSFNILFSDSPCHQTLTDALIRRGGWLCQALQIKLSH